LESLSSQIFVSIPTLSRLESGSGKPSLSTARSLASWLGWSVVRVMDAAEMKADLRAQVG
jgi:transcriptional regulator with XRE-family HTH domain